MGKIVMIDDLMMMLNDYSDEDKMRILKAYDYANLKHSGQFRKSGEAYITHPISASMIVAAMGMDTETIIGDLLHDTAEDTDATLEEISRLFGSNISQLVDSVTKLDKADYACKSDFYMANHRKMLISSAKFYRSFFIKFSDRLHNMRTLGYKSGPKQVDIANETDKFFVPLTKRFGAYKLKGELENLSLRYIDPEGYQNVSSERRKIIEYNSECLYNTLFKIKAMLEDEGIPNDLRIRVKSVYGLYKMMEQGIKPSDLKDLLSIKIIVNEVDECYKTLDLIHSKYDYLKDKDKDFISKPKTNLYQSLHSTVVSDESKLVEAQIRTKKMDRIDNNGVSVFMANDMSDLDERDLEEFEKFRRSLEYITEIDQFSKDDKHFTKHVRDEILNDQIHVFTPNGDIVGLPVGSTPIDFAFRIHETIGTSMIGSIINGEDRPIDSELHSKDKVRIITNPELGGPNENWVKTCKTAHAKRMIKQYCRKVNA